jgi:dihydroxyacetone kinase-like predicted kinase
MESIDVQDDPLSYRYDTQLLIARRDKDLDDAAIGEAITSTIEGNCLIAVGAADLVKIHFHTNEPWRVLELCSGFGEIHDIVVEDMIRQSRGLKG